MIKQKKEVYKEILRNITKTKSISRAIRGIVSDKGGRNICRRLEDYGYINIRYESANRIVDLTEKGKELLNQLNDFNYKFDTLELFGGKK